MKKLIYISLLTLFFMGCDDHLDNLNTDKRNPASVDPETLFTQALRETFDMMTSISVNENVFRLYVQYWAQTTYPEESQYDLTTRNIPENFWANGYRDALIDYKEAKTLIQEQLEEGGSGISDAQLTNRMAVIDIMSAYVYVSMVDAFGDIPYSEALDPDNLFPQYDDAKSIYDGEVENINSALASIDASSSGFSSTQDPVYGGDMESWMKFANSLKLRIGMRLVDVDKAASVTIVNSAISGGVFESNADNASITYYGSSPNTNPIYAGLVLSGRQDFVAANTIVDAMNELDDPRRSVYFRENLGEGVYNGGIYGTANNYSGFTQVGDIFHTPDLAGTILNYAEVEFLQAEAVQRGGYTITGSASEHYTSGIEASFDQWGVEGVDAYVAQPEVAYQPGSFEQRIGIQMWLALYNQGFEAWNTWKRLDFEVLQPLPGSNDLSALPLRFTYPLSEAQLNGEMMQQAAAKIGGDEISTPVFWDVN